MKTPMSSSIKLDKDEKDEDQKMRKCTKEESRLPLGHRASAQLSRLNLLSQRLTERRVSEPFFPTLVREFYLRATYGIGGPIISTVRGVEIRLDLESIYRIFDIAPVGLKVYKSKIWPIMSGFEPREISSLSTRMEELVVVSDTRFYSMEDCMDQYQTGFISQLEYL
uniref:Uncharacterized protein n=1 Tax=Vitis vinifera TaxID=29760 RepID=A5B9D1_VITVI|nr:hypothetical protein VITISV_020297 [Vitis vinifera]